jgi:hypothetical protein
MITKIITVSSRVDQLPDIQSPQGSWAPYVLPRAAGVSRRQVVCPPIPRGREGNHITMIKSSKGMAAVSAVALLTVAAAPASAFATAPAELARSTTAVGASFTADALQDEDQAFGGYVAALEGKKTAVGTVTMPKVTCTSTDAGVSPSISLTNVEETKFAGVSTYAACIDGQPLYAVAVDSHTGSEFLDRPVSANDKIQISITEKGSSAKVAVKNLSAGWSESASLPATDAFGVRAGDFVVLLDGVQVGLPKFKKQNFSGVKVSGKPIASVLNIKFDMVDSRGAVRLQTSAIKKGTDYTETRKGA